MSSFDYEKMNKAMVDRILKSTFLDYDPVRDGDEERKLLLNIIAEDFSADSVGKYGEHLTKKALIEGIDGYKKFVTNLIIPIGNSETEIDLVMIHEKGLLVVESKNYGGLITGSEDEDEWTQMVPSGGRNRFYNPIRQNQVHCDALREVLKIPASEIYSCIVFSERCVLGKLPGNTMYRMITKRDNLLDELKTNWSNRYSLYDKNKIDWVYSILIQYRPSEKGKNEHIQRIKQYTSGSELCPWCGKYLVERKGEYGKFIGCSGYPNCRYTRKI